MNLLINKWLRKHILLNKFTFSVCFSTQESTTLTSLFLNFYVKTGNYLTFFLYYHHAGRFHSTKLLSKNKFYLISKSYTVTIMAQIVLEFIFSLTNNKSLFLSNLFFLKNVYFLFKPILNFSSTSSLMMNLNLNVQFQDFPLLKN